MPTTITPAERGVLQMRDTTRDAAPVPPHDLPPALVVLAGLPGAGKSALADALGRRTGAVVLSVDPVEAAMLRAGVGREEPTGLAAYAVVQTLAADALRHGSCVVLDAVNDHPDARAAWTDLAARCAVPLRWAEVVCTDEAEHRRRLEQRRRDVDGAGGLVPPTWASLTARREALAAWTQPRLVLDAVRPVPELVDELVDALSASAR